jgi:hypothetical protein
VLNAIVPSRSGEIVVFADARQQFAPDTRARAGREFCRPVDRRRQRRAGAEDDRGHGLGGRGTAVYWRYEKFIRSTEGSADSTIGATGAIYAIRRRSSSRFPTTRFSTMC